MEEYLPPVVTKLRADLSDLVLGLTQARALMVAFARGAREDVVGELRNAGRDGGLAFAGGWRSVAASDLTAGFERDVGSVVSRQAEQLGQDAGGAAGRMFAGSFRSVAIPLLIGVLIAATPVLVTALSSIITAGFGLAFIGLGVLALRNQPAIVAAATKLKNDVIAVFKDAASPLIGPIIRALSILDNLVKSSGPQLKQIFTELAPAIEPFTQGFADFVVAVLPGAIALAKAAAVVLTEMAAQGGTVGAGLGDMFTSMAAATPGMVALIRELGPSLGSFLRGTGDVIKFLSDVTLKLVEFKNMAEAGGWDTPWNAYATGARKAWEWITTIAGVVADWVSGKADAVADWWNGVTDAIATKGTQVLTWFRELPGKIGTFVSELPGKLADAAVAAFDAIMFWTAFGITRVVMAFVALPGVLAGLAVQAWNFVSDAFQRGVDNAVAFARALPGRVGAFFSQLWADVTGWAQRTWRDTVAWVKQTADDTIAWFQGLPARAKTAFDSLVERVKTFFKDAKNWLVQAGKDVVQGLLDGITSMIEGAVNAVKRAMEKIREGANAALGVSSPSTVFAEIGRFSMQGYIQGILGESGNLARVWSQVGLAGPGRVVGVAPSAGGALAAAGAGGGTAPMMVHTVINIDGQAVVDAITPAAQQRKARTGETGLA